MSIFLELTKLLTMEGAKAQRELLDLEERLRVFERQYQLSSDEFHRRFRAGEMGDSADMFEWSAFYQMRTSVRERLAMLRGGAALDAAAYLETIKLTLASSPVVRGVVIVQERSLPDQGFFQARLTLQNDNFAEHHQRTPGFPHHMHIGQEDHIEPGRSLGTVDLLDVIESEIAAQ